MSQYDDQDRIFLRGLSVECIIGFIDWERRTAQPIVIDLEVPCDCARASVHDDVAATIDYKLIAKRVISWVQQSQFHLVETLAHRLALLLLAEFPLAWVRVSINKPGAIRHSRDVGVSIVRTRAQLEAAAADAVASR